MKALVIEDDVPQCKWMCLCLEGLGFKTESADNGFKGIKMAIGFQPDLIILDLTLPGLTGIDTLKILKKDPPTNSIQVITVTADLMGHYKKEVMGLGSIYLEKPVTTRKLSFYVEKIVEAFKYRT